MRRQTRSCTFLRFLSFWFWTHFFLSDVYIDLRRSVRQTKNVRRSPHTCYSHRRSPTDYNILVNAEHEAEATRMIRRCVQVRFQFGCIAPASSTRCSWFGPVCLGRIVRLWHKARVRERDGDTQLGKVQGNVRVCAVLNDCVSCEEQSHDNVEQFRAFQPTQCCVFTFYLFIAVRTVRCRYGFLFSPINFLNMKYRSHKFRFSVLSELIGAIALHKTGIDTRYVGTDRKFY